MDTMEEFSLTLHLGLMTRMYVHFFASFRNIVFRHDLNVVFIGIIKLASLTLHLIQLHYFIDVVPQTNHTLTLTTSVQFPLYTLMVFDEWNQGIPVAWVLTSRCAEANLTPPMASLRQRIKIFYPKRKPSAFIVDFAYGGINALTYVSLTQYIRQSTTCRHIFHPFTHIHNFMSIYFFVKVIP